MILPSMILPKPFFLQNYSAINHFAKTILSSKIILPSMILPKPFFLQNHSAINHSARLLPSIFLKIILPSMILPKPFFLQNYSAINHSAKTLFHRISDSTISNLILFPFLQWLLQSYPFLLQQHQTA